MIQITVTVKPHIMVNNQKTSLVKYRALTKSGVIAHSEVITYNSKKELEDRVNHKFEQILQQSTQKDRIENEHTNLHIKN